MKNKAVNGDFMKKFCMLFVVAPLLLMADDQSAADEQQAAADEQQAAADLQSLENEEQNQPQVEVNTPENYYVAPGADARRLENQDLNRYHENQDLDRAHENQDLDRAHEDQNFDQHRYDDNRGLDRQPMENHSFDRRR